MSSADLGIFRIGNNSINMGFSFAKLFQSKSAASSTKGDSTPSSSNGSPVNSRAASVINESVPSCPNEKYLHDPMRHNKRPDYIGGFIDPMGGRSHYSQGVDVTNTGA
ncbi:hypothetical protein BDB00DRAFT_874525 [Zychaea mexicana]|uniref:uncharacterized protein n=1 Tax=Zychaea mexicana TaxID=64656 RepID=UPI0022FE2E15|nr:uncharacterized protein BDB00DRAFT_874525 [Zychaea mexicana]KAI9491293.1 hypothetical protein BDB00DRAFT_874525 [Zychaea mexicana]